jgi:DNA topoisomerase-1
MTLALESLQPVSHETKPPARYTEATLVQELEKLGIGRPSTYAAIIDKLFERSYVAKDGTALIPTFTGFGVVQLLERSFQTLVDYAFTSTMETALDGIATGVVDQLDFLKSFYEGEQGLDRQVKEKMEQVKASDAKRIAIPSLSGDHQILIGRFGPYVLVPTEGDEKDLYVTIPRDVYPGTVSDDDIRRLVASKLTGGDAKEPIGTDPDTGMAVYLFEGKYGPYFQMGLKTDDNPKPKRIGVPKGMDGSQMSLGDVLKLLALPRTLGTDPESGEPVLAGIGKYGPYVSMGKEYRNLPDIGTVHDIALEQALDLLHAPKQSRFKTGAAKAAATTPVREFGEHQDKPLTVHLGRYGYYGKWGNDNFALPADMKKDEAALDSLDKSRMVELAEASAAAPKPAKQRTRKTTAKPKRTKTASKE